MKIVVLDGYTLNPGDLSWERFQKLGDVKVYDRTPEDTILERIGDAAIVITNKTPLNKQTLQQLPNVKYIGVLATGYNVVDTKAAEELGIAVTNIPTYGTAAVAQFVFALLLELCHHVGAHHTSVKRGDWASSSDFCYWNYPLIELAGKTMGMIGFGKIGQATAKIAQALGMKVLAFDKFVNRDIESETMKYVGLDELLSNADVISLHAPLTNETEKMINKDTISKMKDGVMIINTSRGPLIDEIALAEALDCGKVFGAAVDVLSNEPPKKDNPLLQCENCIITPHIAWAPKESRERLMNIAVDNLKAFLEGKPINLVNDYKG